MKQLKQSLLIQRWEKYEFFLHIPHNFIGSNKPFIFYYFKDSNNNKMVRIRKYLSKQNGDIKKIKADAKLVVDEIIELLNCNWNSIYNQTDKTKITALSSIDESIEFWLRSRYAARSQLWQITSSTYCRCRVWLRRKLRPAGTNRNHSLCKIWDVR